MNTNKLWNRYKLKEICNFLYGKGLPKRDRIIGKYPVYGSSGIVDYHKDYYIKGPGIIIGRKGSIGSVFYEKNDFYPIDTVYYVEENKTIDNKKYLYYLLKNMPLQRLNTDAAVPGLNRNTALSQEVMLPSFDSQKNIASILSAYDELIENNNRRIEILEEIAEIIYKEWFVHFRFPGHEKVKMVDLELGKIPEGWEIKQIKYFGKIITGKTPSTLIKENYGKYMPFIKIPNMHDNIYILKTEKYLSKKGVESQRSKIIPSNSLCVSCIGSVGLVSINISEAQTNQQINSIVLNNKESLEFLFFKLRSMKKQIEKYGGKGATMNNLNKKEFSELKIICPPIELIKEYSRVINSIFSKIKTIYTQNNILKSIRDLLLPKLISGKIDVSDLDIKIEDIK